MKKNLSIIVKGAGLYFAGFAVSKVLAFVYRAMLARSLGPSEFGILSIALGLTGLVIVLAALGLYQGILHFAAVYDSTGREAKARGTIIFGLSVQLISSVAFALFLFLISDYVAILLFREPSLGPVLKVLAIALPFSVITSGLMVVVLAFKKIKYKIYVRNIIENVAKIGFTGFLLYLGFGLFGATVGLALSTVLAFIVSFYFVQKKVFPLFGKNLKSEYNVRELFSYSWPLLAVGFFDIIMRSIDTLMLGYLSGAYDAGIYNVAQPTANLLIIAGFAFGSLFLPIITGLYAQKKMKEMYQTFKVVSRWTFSAIFPALLFTILFSAEILAVMFGEQYVQGAGALSILALGIFMVSFVGPVRDILESVKKTKLIFVNTVVSGLLNIALNAWLIPLFGATGNAIIGAALATTLAYLVWNLLAFAEVYYYTRMHPYSKAYIAPTLAAVMAISAFFIIKSIIPSIRSLFFPVDFIVLCILGITFLALYAVMFVVLKGLQPEDIEVLKAIEKKTGIKSKTLRKIVKRFT